MHYNCFKTKPQQQQQHQQQEIDREEINCVEDVLLIVKTQANSRNACIPTASLNAGGGGRGYTPHVTKWATATATATVVDAAGIELTYARYILLYIIARIYTPWYMLTKICKVSDEYRSYGLCGRPNAF